MKRCFDLIDEVRGKVCVFTGAGISTLCGIPDFRGKDGVYRDPNVAKMFDIELFYRDPAFFYTHSASLVYGNAETAPGIVHLAVERLRRAGKISGVITQNIDGLHERAGTPVSAIHGSAAYHHCLKCGAEKSFEEIVAMRKEEIVPRCFCGGVFKPDITFFGEALPEVAWRNAAELAISAELMLVLGTSLTVTPAAYLPQYTLRAGGRIVIVNADATSFDSRATLVYRDLAEFARGVLERY